MPRLTIALCVGAALSFAGAWMQPAASTRAVGPAPLTKEGYATAKKKADAQYKVDREGCAALAGNAKDICVAEAKGRNDIARAEAAVAYENTPATQENARVAQARAAYDVSMERCDDLAGNVKDVCVKEAKAALVKAKADARVERVARNTPKEGTAMRAEVVRNASAEKHEVDYKVALEKCDAFAGTARDACVGDAKIRYGKT